MRYPKDLNKSKLIFPYLQNKVNEYITQTFYRYKSTYQELQIFNINLKIDCKKLHQQNQTLIRKTQFFEIQNMHFRNKNANYISKI